MSEIGAVYQILRGTLVGDAAWGEVYPERVPPGVTRPYVVIIYSGGGREQWRTDKKNAGVLVTVKCVANTAAEAIAGQTRIEALLDAQGSQEGDGLADHATWDVLTVTISTAVAMVEAFEGVDEIYHYGHQYRLEMETK